MKNIVLIGFMGCGKSFAGALAAELAGCQFIETDALAEDVAGMSIPCIFEKFGEIFFREMERAAVGAAAAETDCIIATGGGVVKSAESISLLRKNSVIVYLKATAERLCENLMDDDSRPLLDGLSGADKLARIKEMLDERGGLYEASADVIIDVTDLTFEEAAAEIARIYGER